MMGATQAEVVFRGSLSNVIPFPAQEGEGLLASGGKKAPSGQPTPSGPPAAPPGDIVYSLRTIFLSSKLGASVLLLVPLTVASHRLGWGEGLTFAFALAALCPLAERLNFLTEQCTCWASDVVAAILNVSFGNMTELIVSLFALRAGLLRVLQLSLLGAPPALRVLRRLCAPAPRRLPHQGRPTSPTAARSQPEHHLRSHRRERPEQLPARPRLLVPLRGPQKQNPNLRPRRGRGARPASFLPHLLFRHARRHPTGAGS